MRLNRFEQETIIRFDESCQIASIYTASPKVKARLQRLGLKPEREEGESAWFTVPKKAIMIFCREGSVVTQIPKGRQASRFRVAS